MLIFYSKYNTLIEKLKRQDQELAAQKQAAERQNDTLRWAADILQEHSYRINTMQEDLAEEQRQRQELERRLSYYVRYLSEQSAGGKPTVFHPGDCRRVLQVVQNLKYGDAIGNITLAVQRFLEQEEYITDIFAQETDPRLGKEVDKPFFALPELTDHDILIYHYGGHCGLASKVTCLPGKKALYYHNVTPPEFFATYSTYLQDYQSKGIEQLEQILRSFDLCFTDSNYNRQELLKMGFLGHIQVVPVCLETQDYSAPPDKSVIQKYSEDDIAHFLIVGQVMPHKRIEDALRVFARYQEGYGRPCRLFVVGQYDGLPAYYEHLQKIIAEGHIENVVFTGHVPFCEIISYYKLADIYLCTSEHEGFCMPLLESMFYQLPVIAYSCAAVPGTLGDNGLLMQNKDPGEWAERIHQVLSDPSFCAQVVDRQNCKRTEFAPDRAQESFRQGLSYMMG